MHTTVPCSKAASELQRLLRHRDSGVSSLYLKPLPPLGSHSPNGYLQGIYHLLGKLVFFFFLSKCSSKHGPQTSTRFHTAHYRPAKRSGHNEEQECEALRQCLCLIERGKRVAWCHQIIVAGHLRHSSDLVMHRTLTHQSLADCKNYNDVTLHIGVFF